MEVFVWGAAGVFVCDGEVDGREFGEGVGVPGVEDGLAGLACGDGLV
jgi:hypothetical protein